MIELMFNINFNSTMNQIKNRTKKRKYEFNTFLKENSKVQ